MGEDTVGECVGCGATVEAKDACEMPNGRVYHIVPGQPPYMRDVCGVIKRKWV